MFGRRVAYWRERRGLTQRDFATLMGQSLRWVQDVEGGRRQTDPRLSVVERVAEVLRVPVSALVDEGDGVAGRQCVDSVELEIIRATLQRYDVMTGSVGEDSTEPVPLEALRGRLVHARGAFQAGHFASLGRLLPALLVEANRAAARCEEGEGSRLDAYRVLALTCDLAEAASVKYGDGALAFTCSQRAVAAAERSQDPVIMASTVRHLADAMTHQGQAPGAVQLALTAAARLERDLLARGADGLSVLGMLYLKAAMASASIAASDDRKAAAAARAVGDLLDQAGAYAQTLGADGNALWTAFGPTNVAVHRVTAYVQLGRGADAIAAARGISPCARSRLPRERRARLAVDLARGLMQAGQRAEAVDALLQAEREAAEEVRSRPRTRELIEELRALGVGRAEGRLRELAVRCGLSG